jgi:hypothetical protein
MPDPRLESRADSCPCQSAFTNASSIARTSLACEGKLAWNPSAAHRARASWTRSIIYPYLLRDLPINKADQVWCADMTCRGRGIDPQTNLREVLTRLPTLTNRQIKDLTPEAQAKTRQIEGQQKAAYPSKAKGKRQAQTEGTRRTANATITLTSKPSLTKLRERRSLYLDNKVNKFYRPATPKNCKLPPPWKLLSSQK